MKADLIESFLIVATFSFAFLGIIALPILFSGSFDSTVVNHCRANGYWQVGQTRIVCTVEGKK